MAKIIAMKEKEIEKDSDVIASVLAQPEFKKYNFLDKEKDSWQCSFGALSVDIALKYFTPSIVRLYGGAGMGKTSFALQMAREFQQNPKVRNPFVIYIDAECRMMQHRLDDSGVDSSKSKFLLFHCNCTEDVYKFIDDVIKKNEKEKPDNRKTFLIIIDSLDVLTAQAELSKEYTDQSQVGIAAQLNTKMIRKQTLPITKNNHCLIILNGMRSDLSKVGTPSRGVPRPKPSGGKALEHAANITLFFEDKWQSDIIYADPATKKDILGSYCKIEIIKTPFDQAMGAKITYPVKHGATGGNKVWRSYMIRDLLLAWGLIEKISQGWFGFNEDQYTDLKKLGVEDFDAKIHGENGILDFLEKNPKIIDFYEEKMKTLIA